MTFKKLCLTTACAALISFAGVATAQSAPSIAQTVENSKEAVPTAFDPVAHKRVLGISEQLRCWCVRTSRLPTLTPNWQLTFAIR